MHKNKRGIQYKNENRALKAALKRYRPVYYRPSVSSVTVSEGVEFTEHDEYQHFVHL